MPGKTSSLCALAAPPIFIILISFFGPFLTDTIYVDSDLGVGVGGAILPGLPTIDPNDGVTSFALGARAAFDVLSGHLPLWNHYEGLGAPLLGGMQSAALFPPTWLLALPHGQAVEQALLQFLAGVGAYLFFRRFGLGSRAALAGALVYEVNGVFAWLHNAIFNPIAFLPWLLLVIESACAHAIAGDRLPQRMTNICLGAVIAALSVYAGFPEEVYLYTLLLIVWSLFRMFGLTRSQVIVFGVDLILVGVVALILCAPVLLAFAAFLSEAALSHHVGNGFYGALPAVGTLLQYILPYVFGPIFASHSTVVTGSIWSATGGYIGLMSLMLAGAALFVPGYRGAKAVLVAWIILALGVSHGLPGIYQAFMALPLTKIAATFRYLNPSWIFCLVFLSAMFIDCVPSLSPSAFRRAAMWGVASGVICAGLATALAWPLISERWAAEPEMRVYMLAATVVAGGLCAGLLFAASTRHSKIVRTANPFIFVAEAIAWYFTPYLSYPRQGIIDKGLITFLQAHVGYQRTVATFEEAGRGVFPGYGSYLGIPTLNYDNLPVPQRTVDYVQQNLDAYASTLFLPWEPDLPPDQKIERRQLFYARLPAYANVGVKYVLAGPDFDPELTAVYRGLVMTVYELPQVRDYFSADGCDLTPISFDVVDASCSEPSKLTRLEIYMRGWSATANGQPEAMNTADDVFQSVELPAGKTRIAFTYEPRGFAVAWPCAVVTLLLVMGVLFRQVLLIIASWRVDRTANLESTIPLPLA